MLLSEILRIQSESGRVLQKLPSSTDEHFQLISEMAQQTVVPLEEVLKRENEEMKGKCATAEFDFIFVLDASGNSLAFSGISHMQNTMTGVWLWRGVRGFA